MINREKEQIEEMRKSHKYVLEREPDCQVMSAEDMDEIMQNAIGQSYLASIFDERGCYMGRDGYRLEPKVMVEAIRLALEANGILLEPPHDEPEENEDEESD